MTLQEALCVVDAEDALICIGRWEEETVIPLIFEEEWSEFLNSEVDFITADRIREFTPVIICLKKEKR